MTRGRNPISDGPSALRFLIVTYLREATEPAKFDHIVLTINSITGGALGMDKDFRQRFDGLRNPQSPNYIQPNGHYVEKTKDWMGETYETWQYRIRQAELAEICACLFRRGYLGMAKLHDDDGGNLTGHQDGGMLDYADAEELEGIES